MLFLGLPASGPSAAQDTLNLRLERICEACVTAADARVPATTEAIFSVQLNLEAKGDVVVLIAQDGDVLLR